MAKNKNVKVMVLKNHNIGRNRIVGMEYLLDEYKVPFMVRQGYVVVMEKPKKIASK